MKLKFTALMLASALVFAGCGSNKEAVEPAKNEQPAAAQEIGQDAPKVENWDEITEQYRQFAVEQADSFVIETEKFVKAVKSGDLEGAKKLYAPTRMYFERIEPIAEALGDFDPNIDARENDVEEKDWRGFHRIEKALWENNTTEGMDGYADTLLQDAKLLRALMETVEVEPSLLVTGAVELLNEVSSSKVTGEEERYSHTDLYDFAANVEGAKKIYELLKVELGKQDAELESEIGTSFKNLEEALASYKSGDGYVSYLDLKQEDTKKLSQLLDALAEPLSQMGTILGA
ncbi:iron uptake system protein EfeO [Paenibacillus radicis (ex Gao et al. 2016)]|uniref:Iron ABC transporter substrate-binding protein n=1 Tax=Paenibacillus radicis (ex Gao et al. 2016) TaxID=1737354 RepID=A0A917HKZ0_9BACL|nr:iron uptake system protein EfeO [Paenibacillus radicis (ex Gao et al. 2016)]GGG82551.1 iron ABC transporter substrate-binding protein [Paenibacillus radicis (ex Gao et al. 2016)]